jgi:hypothetical protein
MQTAQEALDSLVIQMEHFTTDVFKIGHEKPGTFKQTQAQHKCCELIREIRIAHINISNSIAAQEPVVDSELFTICSSAIAMIDLAADHGLIKTEGDRISARCLDESVHELHESIYGGD